MTLNEFKYWLQGYSENMGEAPTLQQWNKIKAQLDRVVEKKEVNFNPAKVEEQPWKKFYGASPIKIGEVTC